MEPKNEPKKVNENKIIKVETTQKEELSNNSNDNTSKNIKVKNLNQFNKLELNNQHFQIIQQKSNLQENSEDIKQKKERIDDHKALSDKDIINFKNKSNNASTSQITLNEIKETGKKSRSQDQKETTYNYYKYNDNNQNVYSLLNNYYKDIDLNFKDKKASNPGKNFQLKNKFQEKANNTNNIPPNNYIYTYNYPFIPYFYYQNPYMNNNPNINSSFNFQDKSNSNQENAFNINNQINYHLSNNINYYNYNFNKNNFNHIKQKKKYKIENDEYKLYSINVDNIIKGTENRTTVMIRHIPNKYTYQNLQKEINIVCKDKYDFLYLPIDSDNNCNLGYAFINFINPLHIVNFYLAFKSRKWLCFNSFKECDFSFAKYQGKAELTSNFAKNINKIDDKRRIPMVFLIKNEPKIDLPKKYYEMIREHNSKYLNNINWI